MDATRLHDVKVDEHHRCKTPQVKAFFMLRRRQGYARQKEICFAETYHKYSSFGGGGGIETLMCGCKKELAKNWRRLFFQGYVKIR